MLRHAFSACVYRMRLRFRRNYFVLSQRSLNVLIGCLYHYQGKIPISSQRSLSNFNVELSEDLAETSGRFDVLLCQLVVVAALLRQDVLVDVGGRRLHAVLVPTHDLLKKNIINLQQLLLINIINDFMAIQIIRVTLRQECTTQISNFFDIQGLTK